MKGSFPIEKFNTVRTPFYYYDTELLRKTLDTIKAETGKNDNYHVHYAVKPMPTANCCASSVRLDSEPTA